MLATQKQISALLPQRPPFIMVDQLLEASEERIRTRFEIRPDNVFLEGEVFREFGLIENIAQSSAAGIAFLHLQTANPDPGAIVEGFLAAISNLMLYQLPVLGTRLETHIFPLHQFGAMYLVKGEVYTQQTLLMDCRMKLAGKS